MVLEFILVPSQQGADHVRFGRKVMVHAGLADPNGVAEIFEAHGVQATLLDKLLCYIQNFVFCIQDCPFGGHFTY